MLEEFVCMMNDMCERGGSCKILKCLLNESNFLFYIHSTVILIQCVKCISYTLNIYSYISYTPINPLTNHTNALKVHHSTLLFVFLEEYIFE